VPFALFIESAEVVIPLVYKTPSMVINCI